MFSRPERPQGRYWYSKASVNLRHVDAFTGPKVDVPTRFTKDVSCRRSWSVERRQTPIKRVWLVPRNCPTDQTCPIPVLETLGSTTTSTVRVAGTVGHVELNRQRCFPRDGCCGERWGGICTIREVVVATPPLDGHTFPPDRLRLGLYSSTSSVVAELVLEYSTKTIIITVENRYH